MRVNRKKGENSVFSILYSSHTSEQKHSVVAVYHAVSVNVGVLQIEIIIDKAGSVAKDQNPS